jgi:hypothetical protein
VGTKLNPILFYPFYLVAHGPRKGLRKFQYVTAEEYRLLGRKKAKQIETATVHNRSPEGIAYQRKHKQTPEYKAYQREYQREYQQTPERKALRSEYRQTPEYKTYWRQYQRKRRKDPQFAAWNRIRWALWNFLKGAKSSRTAEYVGCNAEHLWQHLSSTLPKGYTIDDWGPRLHIDHIAPLKGFDATNPMHVKIAWNWKNLRLLPGPENISKGAKILKPLQLPLPLAA